MKNKEAEFFFAMLLTIVLILSSIASAQEVQPGELIYYKGVTGSSYDWYLYVPQSLDKSIESIIWVTGLHGNYVTDDYSKISTESREKTENRMKYAEEQGLILLVPVIPRPKTDYVYTVAFPEKVFQKDVDLSCWRPDLKLNMIIDELQSDLIGAGYKVKLKIFINGFSAGAMFAQRYALLHPERVLALVVGQCGGALTLPEERYNNGTDYEMNWPVGIANYQQLTGKIFYREAYLQIKQLIFIGEDDTENSTLVRVKELWNTESEINFLNQTFGDTDPVRIQNQAAYMKKIGCDVQFMLYPNLGHTQTKEMRSNMFQFFNANKQ